MGFCLCVSCSGAVLESAPVICGGCGEQRHDRLRDDARPCGQRIENRKRAQLRGAVKTGEHRHAQEIQSRRDKEQQHRRRQNDDRQRRRKCGRLLALLNQQIE